MMSCHRCGRKVRAWNLEWCWVFFPGRGEFDSERKFALVCQRCKTRYRA